MPRRLASHVHLTTARLLQSKVLATPPVWYNAVMMYPPIPLPPRDPVHRPRYYREKDLNEKAEDYRIPFDLPARTMTKQALELSRKRTKPAKPRAQPIEYVADRIRQQFFRDHPFEALRPQTLVQGEKIPERHLFQGKKWVRLGQNGRNPSPESAVQFALSLYEHHDIPLSIAYHKAAAQFRSLRGELAVASKFALMEAKFFQAEFAPNESQRGVDLTKHALMTWAQTNVGARRKTISIRNRFFPVWKGRTGVPDYWSRGVGYTKRWSRAIPPIYWPSKVELRAARTTARGQTKQYGEGNNLRLSGRRSPSISDPIQ